MYKDRARLPLDEYPERVSDSTFAILRRAGG